MPTLDGNGQRKAAPPKFYTPKEFYLKHDRRIGRDTIYRLIAEGRIRSVRPGKRKILIPASELRDGPEREIRGAN